MTESRKSEHAYHLDNTDPSLAPHLFETLKDVQGKCPVAWSDAGDGFWMLTKYADITAAANDWETYTVEEGHTIPSTGKSVMLPLAEVDPPLHTPWRRFLVPYFTPKTVEGYRPVIERIVEDAFSGLAASGRGDLVFDVARKVPTATISAILGFEQDGNHISDIVDEWMASTGDPQRARRAADAVEAVVREEIGKRRGKPAEDVLGRIMEGEVEGAPLTDDELLGLCIVFIVAGHGTTVDGITNTVHRVLAEPGLLAALQADRSRLGKVIDESLRIHPPVWNMGRTARKDAEVRGVGICPGEKVMLTFGAGNYDPEKFAEPDRFDPDRPGVHGHLTFGFGRHRCIGEALAKLEIAIVLEYVLDRLPDLVLDGEVTARTYFTTYGFTALPVRHGSAAATA
ncbi:cytochrome P450 [Streptomyces sp. NPDC046924]|uniref:cytochrome P450 n=1 Tax=Streptomyces sp. NPDC046924 TaxID=3155136 RepID=UPI0033E2B68C